MKIILMHKIIAQLPNGKWRCITASQDYEGLKKLHRKMESEFRIKRIETKVKLKSFIEVEYGTAN